MQEKKLDFITTAEAILFVGSLFMWIYVAHTFVFIDSFASLFFIQSWWLLLPLMTFLMFLTSFISRRTEWRWSNQETKKLNEKRKA
ncbi:hypothetical protein [Exiguobacterium sp. H66]|uniref:hypothetical protein n=1 Tax=Exiguobacterium sp. H66 TaxID=2751208 RepID=UPI001BE7A649|nr:hypothetical protein [Exiguobacterium sp. H66]